MEAPDYDVCVFKGRFAKIPDKYLTNTRQRALLDYNRKR